MSLVSVIIPTYNRAHCVTRAIDSALGQTHAEVEAIVIDDGSTDRTRALLRERYGDDPRVRYLYQDNGGVAHARNTGLAAARGQFVALLDSDDVWHPWKLAAQLEALRLLPDAGMVWTDMEAIDPEGHVQHARFLRSMYHAYRWFPPDRLFSESHEVTLAGAPPARLYAGDIFSQMVMGSLVHTSTVLLRRERLERAGGFNERYRSGEDYDFHLRTCREGPVAFLDVASIRYQLGYEDRLTSDRYRLELARNALETLTTTLARDRHRIRLPRWMIRRRLAQAHARVGEEALALGKRGEARSQLARSLWHRPEQIRVAGLLLLACLPAGLGESLRRVWRAMPSWRRTLTSAPAPSGSARVLK